MLFFNGDGVFVFRNSIDGSSQLDSDPIWLAMVVHVVGGNKKKAKRGGGENKDVRKKNKKGEEPTVRFQQRLFKNLHHFFDQDQFVCSPKQRRPLLLQLRRSTVPQWL